MREVRIYQLGSGREPFTGWYDGLKDAKAKLLVDNAIRRLAANLSVDSRRVRKGVYELRVHVGPGYRVYFGKHRRSHIVLLLGGSKGAQKSDIEKAVAYWQYYKREYDEKSE